jgi:hypothetical protein
MLTTCPSPSPASPRSREFFSRYTEQTKLAAGGEVEVLPLEIVAQTKHRA